jgi:hypothetical protein
MLFKQIASSLFFSKNHTKSINTLCGQNALLLNVKKGGTYSYHWILKGLLKRCFALMEKVNNAYKILVRKL